MSDAWARAAKAPPLLKSASAFGSTTTMVRYVHHYDCVVAYKAVSRLCAKLRLQHRPYRLPYGTEEPRREWVCRSLLKETGA